MAIASVVVYSKFGQNSRIASEVLYGILATNMRENFRYIMSDGACTPFRLNFDTDNDGKVSKAEYEADVKQFRANSALKDAPFEALEANADGEFSAADIAKS